MIRRLGLALMVFGLVFLAAAGGLFVQNRVEDAYAGKSSAQALARLDAVLATAEATVETVTVGDDTYLGRLTIPRLALELPILSRWSYENLKTAPCRYSGSAADADLVLLAHNYRKHFGPIRRLKTGDRVTFESADGTIWEYQVTATVVVDPDDPEALTAGSHALTLVTCTYGGQTRVIVRCDLR